MSSYSQPRIADVLKEHIKPLFSYLLISNLCGRIHPHQKKNISTQNIHVVTAIHAENNDIDVEPFYIKSIILCEYTFCVLMCMGV